MNLKTICLALALSACQIPAPNRPVAPVDARASTFRVDITKYDVDTDKYEPVGSGTAWISYNKAGRSYLVTAGHICAEGEAVSYTLVAPSGVKTSAMVERTSDKYDLCLMVAEKDMGPGMELAPAMPEYDEMVMAVGAPLGVYGCDSGSTIEECGMAPISRGYYAGGTLVSMPMTGGNSGSAVFTARGVIGVLVEGYRGFDSLSFVEPRGHIVEFLAESDVI